MSRRILLSLFILTCIRLSALGQSGVDKPVYDIVTYRDTSYLGTFTIELFPSIAPLHVNNFDSLVNVHFFDSTAFHRVVPGFVIQGGDPNSISGPISTWGMGQPWQPTVNAEFNAVKHNRGILGAARDTDINSANSQFYICVAPALFLDGNYTVYGKVTAGMNIVDTIVNEPRDVNDVPLQKISMFITRTGVNDSVPATPTLIAPADSAVNIGPSTSFSWTGVPGAVLYTVQVASDSLFTNIISVNNFGAASGSGVKFPGSASFYWRVQANNGGHMSPWSNYRLFTAVPDSADLISPADSATGVYLNQVFSWHPVPGADKYMLQVSKSANFAGQTSTYANLTDTAFQVTNLLTANTVYYWRVRSFVGTLGGFFSETRTFTTGTTLGLEVLPEEETCTIYPNPANDQIQLRFTQIPAPETMISITDVSGKLLFSTSGKEAMNLRMSVDVSSWPSGIYSLQLNRGTQRFQQFFVVQ